MAIDDEVPVPPSLRTFTWWDFASLWISLVIGIPSYYAAGSLVELGMTWWQGIATVVLANAILLFPLLLTSAVGARHGISFPILARASFGVTGAQLPTFLRALVACGWSGINTWVGGQAILLLFPASNPTSWARRPLPFFDISPLDSFCFLVFLALEIAVIWKGMASIRYMGRYSAPILAALTVVLFMWALVQAGGFGAMLSPVPTPPSAVFWSLFFPGLAANIGTWSTVTLNVADFTRYARSQVDQAAGQLGLPLLTGAFAFVGLAVTSATTVIFGTTISDPLRLVSKIVETSGSVVGSITAVVSILGICLAVITTTVPASVVASANVLVNLRPSLFGFRSASVTTLVVGAVVFQPWRAYRSSDSFLNAWLLGYSIITGSISGIMLADYYLVRRTVLDVDELYSTSHEKRCNPTAIVALIVSMVAMVPGFLRQVGVLADVHWLFRWIYDVSWFFGFLFAGGGYWAVSSFSSYVRRDRRPASMEAKLLC